jgi:hypothetical protein
MMPRTMTFASSARIVAMAPRLRLVVLVAFALFVAHDAIYVAEYGIGDGFAAAMAARGHDGYWLPFTLLAGSAAVVAFLVSLVVLRRLRETARGMGPAAGPSYVVELTRTWRLVLPVTVVLFALQENLEHYLARGHLVGLDPLGGAGYELALPVLALVTFGIVAVGALVRWRIAVLHARLVAGQQRPRRHVMARRVAREWLASITFYEWLEDRRDAGRAPPALLRPITPTAA